MKKKYSLLLIAFLCFIVSGYGQTYSQITAIGDLTDGNYLIVGDGTSNDGLMLNSTAGSVYIDYSTITNPGANITTGFTTDNVFNITVTGGNITIYNSSVGYASWGRSGATANDADFFNGTIADNERWTPTVSGGLWTLSNVDDSSRVLQWNNSAPRFVAYTSSQIKLKLYKEVISCTDELNFVNIQSPTTTQTITEGDNFDVYSQAYDALYTLLPGANANIEAWIGYNTVDNNPSSAGWTWIPATFNLQVGNNDEYLAEIGSALAAGTYYYASRYRLNGCGFTYGGTGGNWNNDSVELIVEPDQVNFCNVDFPKTATIPVGANHNVYAQAYEPGVTEAAGQGANIEAWIGYNTVGINYQPWQTTGWTWVPASYDSDSGNNDQYVAEIGSGRTAGTYYYASRFRLNGSAFSYGGIAADNVGNFWDATNNNGTLTVFNPPNNATAFTGCINDTTIDLSWNAPASGTTPDGYVVFAIEGGAFPAGAKGAANTYTANTDFSAATTVTPATLGKVVYKGTGTAVSITGLTEDTFYSFAVFAYTGEAPTGWSSGSGASRIINQQAQGDIRNFVPTPLTNQVTLNWLNPTPISCWDEIVIVANQGAVAFTPTGDGSAYTANAVYSGANQVVYKGTGNVVAVTGLTNGTNYCFRAFIRRGTTWTPGVEVCAVPSLTYCDSYGDGSDGYFTLINNVEFNTIDNPSPTGVDNAYSDFTAISTTVELGQTYNLDVRVETDGAFTTTTRAWIDWNNDGDFNDAGEQYELGNAYNVVDGSTDGSPLAIEVPTNAAIAATRMRVSTRFNTTPSTSCQQNFDGEVEDYTINITQPANAEINIKGNNITIENGFNAPYGLNNTLFGSTNVGATSAEKSYFVENIGASTLTLSGAPRVQLIGAHPGDFNVTLQPSATVGSLADSEFRIEFSPTSDGTRTATVRIVNNDSDENPYEFDIEGTAVCSTVLTSSIWPTEGPENTEVTITSATDLTGASATINGITMPIVSTTATELVVTVPANAINANIIVEFSTGCSSSNAFTVVDDVISGCETTTSSTVPSDLFISEVSDASSGSSSLIEIFNGTAGTINLANYSIRIFNNGSSTPSTTANLTGTLASGSIHVISVGTTSCDLTGNGLSGGLPHQTFNSAGGINFDNNSSDAIELYNNTTSTSIDVFGELGSSTWANGLGIGGDGVNYRRQNTASPLPSTVWDITQWDEIDWTGCADSDYSDFGTYDFSLGVPPSVSVLNDPTLDCANAIQLSVTGTEGVPAGLPLAYRWYYLAPNTSTFVVVPNNADFNNVTSATLDIVNPVAYNDYQFYCQVRENTATCYQASNAVKIDGLAAVWDTTGWSDTPTLNKVAIINDDYDTSVNVNGETSFEACQCIVNNGNELTIANNTFVRVNTDLTVNGSMVVQQGGSFVQVDDAGVINGNVLTTRSKISVEKRTSNLASYFEYTYWSSPVSGELISNGLAEAQANRIYWYSGQNYLDATREVNNDNTTVSGQDDIDDNGDDWQFAAGGMVMAPGVGYAATHNTFSTYPNQFTYIFEGPFNNGVYNVPIYRNDSETADNNWNFIGNPYPSAIVADLFLAANASIDQTAGSAPTTGAIFFWSHATAADANTNGNENLNYAQSDYAIINGSGATAGGDGVTPNRYIPSGQGFFVSMDNAAASTVFSGTVRTTDVVFNNSMRTTGNNNQFFRTDNTSAPNKIWVNLTSDNGVFNQILVAYVDGATDNDDGMYFDAERNMSTEAHSTIYTSIDATSNKRFAIQGKEPNSLSADEVIPVGFSTTITEPTIYQLSLHQFEGDFMTTNDVYLRDKYLNVVLDFKANTYSFNSATGNFNDRFEIIFSNQSLSIEDTIADTNDLIITELQNGDVQFKIGKTLTIDKVLILDILGRQIYDLRGNNSTEVYNLSKLSNAAYIAKVTLSNGQVISKKAIKQH